MYHRTAGSCLQRCYIIPQLILNYNSFIMPKRFSDNPSSSRKRIKSHYNHNSAFSKLYSTEKSNFLCKTITSNLKDLKKMDTESVVDNQNDIVNIKVEYLDAPTKSENDKKEYRVIKLPNGLTALLISDPHNANSTETPFEAASVDFEEDDSDDSSNNDSKEDEKVDDDDDDVDDDDDNDNTDEENAADADDELAGFDDDDDDDEGCNFKLVKREEKMAACGLCVGVGSFSDPPEIPGLAHFLEHMVFMGSEKYCFENDFDSFIQKHGGYDNASTDTEQTTFYFEIDEKYLFPALDRFAQFFVSPLMLRNAITREREAVENEFKMALPSDVHRKDQLFCSLAKKDHPASKFTWGNLITLRDNIDDDKLYEQLHKFRERHYSAHRMTVAIQAKLPLDTLENYVKKCFSTVPNNNLPGDDFTDFLNAKSFDTPQFRRIFKVKPIKDVCEVELTWAMPSLHHLYKIKPHQYISWIIGHEGKGSLINYLRKKMWCLDISSGNGESGYEHSSMYALFSLTLILTDEGHKNIKNVLDAIFSYINMMRLIGPQERIFNEIRSIADTTFRFNDEEPAVEYVEELCENMHYYKSTDYITGSELYWQYDPTSIINCMNILIPENVNIIIFDKKFDESTFEKEEPWFKTKYTDLEIPNQWIEDWKSIKPFSEFHLPEPNIFITNNFDLIPIKVFNYPMKIYNNGNCELWYKADSVFRLPECSMDFYFMSPLVAASPEGSAMMSLLSMILKHILVEELYPAIAADLNFEIYSADVGLIIKTFGFNQQLPLLLEIIIKHLAQFNNHINEDLFLVLKEQISKSAYNLFIKPKKVAKDVRLSLLMLNYWTAMDRYQAGLDVTYDQFKVFADSFIKRNYIKCLIEGNMTSSDAIKHVKNYLEILKCQPLLAKTMPELRAMKLPEGSQCCRVKNFNPSDSNSVITNYYQIDITSIKLSVIVELIIMMMEEPLFNHLRTEEQLGYDVSCLLRDTYGVLGFSITVNAQADKFTVEHVENRIDNFLKTKFNDILFNESANEFDSVKEALIKLKKCADVHLKEDVVKNWGEITSGRYVFDRLAKEIEAIEQATLQDVRLFFSNYILDANNLKKISIQVVGNDKKTKPSAKLSNDDNKIDYTLQHLGNLPDEKIKKPDDYFIMDIQKYKRGLYVFPIENNE